jgi:hypothetical protein
MATQAQIDANRANAKKSTGPRTLEGKARSRANALRHGLSGTAILMECEHEDEFNEMVDDLLEEWQPATITEKMVFYKMVEQYWLSRRATTQLAESTEYLFCKDGDEKDARNVSLMLRYNQNAMRGFFKAMNELLKLQKNRKQIQQNQSDEPEIGFVSQNDPEPAPAPAQTPAPPPPTPIRNAVAGTFLPLDPEIPCEMAA